MSYNATPVGKLPNLKPQQNDPELTSQVMKDAYLDNHPSFHQSGQGQQQQQEQQQLSIIPENLIEQLKDPLLVALVFVIINSDFVKGLLDQHINSDDLMKQLLVKAGLAGLGYMLAKHLLNK